MKNMKTIKSLLYLLVAAGALAVVGCTKDETYTKGGDIDGERIYIDNTVSVFYVKTAEEKQEEAKELAQLRPSVRQNIESSADDKSVTINVCRMNSKLNTYTTTVELTLPSDSYQLFELPAGATQSGAGTGTVTYSFEVAFDEGADKTSFDIGFEIAELTSNVEYEMTATIVDDGNTSYYGASSIDFSICHSEKVELPFTDIGKVTLTESFFRDMLGYALGSYSDCVIQIHNDDLKAINDAKTAGTEPKFDYLGIRFYIPRLMYQIAAASIEAGETEFEEEDLEYFADGDGLMLTMTPQYEIIDEDAAPIYPNPLKPKEQTTGYSKSSVIGVNSIDGSLFTGRLSENEFVFLATVPLTIEGYGETYIIKFPDSYGFGTNSRTLNTYTYGISYWAINSPNGSLWPQPLTITWDTNDLESDWANYFKIDYNTSINYVKAAGSGTFSSTAFPTDDQGESKPQTWNQDLYVGYDSATGNTVYYLPEVYQTVTSEENEYGLAVLVNGSSVTVASDQQLGMQWNGNEISAQQSESIASSVEYAEDGSVKKLTLGVAFVLPNGNVMADYTETYEFNSSAAGVEAFYGTYTQNASVVYMSSLIPVTSTVTISQAVDSNNTPITGKVFINGMIATAFLDDEAGIVDGRLVGEYDAVSNSIIIPAQFFYKPVWPNFESGIFTYGGYDAYPYFQPGVGVVNSYNNGAININISEIGNNSTSCALYRDQDGNLTLSMSTTDSTGNKANAYAISIYAFDSDYNEFVSGEDILYATYYNNSDITFTKTGTSSNMTKNQNNAKKIVCSVKKDVKRPNPTNSAPKKAYEFPQLGKSINPEQLGR